jgi:DNA polymerase III subunit beta
MKVKIDKNKIIDAISNVQGITGRKAGLTISSCVLIKALGSEFHIIANDSETGFKGFYPAVVEEEGEAAISSRKFFEIIKDYPEDEVLITKIEENIVKIGDEKIEFNIVCLDTEEFLALPDIENPEFFTMKSLSLKKMLEKIHMISFSSDERRTYILGINFEVINDENNKIIRVVSTDGSRLSKYDSICDESDALPSTRASIIPKRGITELYKFIDEEENINIGFDNSNFILKKDNETLIIRLLEGSFPNYENILKKDDYFSIKLNKEKFLKMIKRMSILSLTDYKGVLFEFNKEKMILSAENPEIGESREDMKIEFEGEPFKIAFNPKFFLELGNVVEDENIILYLKDEKNSCVIEGETSKHFISVIMPMII